MRIVLYAHNLKWLAGESVRTMVPGYPPSAISYLEAAKKMRTKKDMSAPCIIQGKAIELLGTLPRGERIRCGLRRVHYCGVHRQAPHPGPVDEGDQRPRHWAAAASGDLRVCAARRKGQSAGPHLQRGASHNESGSRPDSRACRWKSRCSTCERRPSRGGQWSSTSSLPHWSTMEMIR